ncbi:panthothenate synthetase [Carboxylicivirga marina]|uniref:Panthothenate synthetase n=1 Tax=Carboxylicivirga marina TaxID=2800988 RepID=A0ABS1HPE6_9BACT|nr:panthothenate synthetase [Carboxylicivirga marina]MBK3519564.1 panthothenate synthetase [Carboxylicivirga marina]
MKMIVSVTLPVEPFNSLQREGKVGELMGRIMEDIKPESVYFTENAGCRAALMVVEVADASMVPKIAEPWYLNFEADCEFRLAMSMDDLIKADLNQLAKKWS